MLPARIDIAGLTASKTSAAATCLLPAGPPESGAPTTLRKLIRSRTSASTRGCSPSSRSRAITREWELGELLDWALARAVRRGSRR
jgi:hypothetical protein